MAHPCECSWPLPIGGGTPPGGAPSSGFPCGAPERGALRAPHELIFVSEDLRRAFRGRGRVVPNGVPVAEIRSAAFRARQLRNELGVGNAFVVVYVGRVTLDKGILTLVLACERARATLTRDLRLIIVGPVEERIRPELERRAAASRGWLILLGERSDPYAFIALAELFALPSTREGMPLSLLEAMAAGRPVIGNSTRRRHRKLPPRVLGHRYPSEIGGCHTREMSSVLPS